MTLLVVWGAVVSLIAATAEGLAMLPRPNLPLVGEQSPIAGFPIAALIAFEVAVVLGVLRNGGQAITLDEWKRLVDKDNYDYVYDYDYGKPYRKLVYFPASAPDDSESYFDSEEHEGGGEEEEGEEHRRVSQYAVPPFSHYQPASYSQASRPAASYNQRVPPASSYGQGPYPPPEALPYRRYKRDLEDFPADTVLEDLTKAVEDLQMEKDEKVVQEGVKELTGQVLELDKDDCLLKLLCHLQKKPQGTRDFQEDVMLSLFRMNAPTGAPTCEQEFSKCPVEEAQLVEGFSYLWQMQNTV